MTDFLVFQLVGPMAAWGDVAVGEFRGTRDDPGASALIGLLAAALGIDRADDGAHAALRDGYAWAVGTLSPGDLLRDYHTAQVPGRTELAKRPHRTRRDELAVPRPLLNTVLSTRDYRLGGAWLVASQALEGAPHPLSALAAALQEPRYVPYLGRKCCPTAAPMAPRLLAAESAVAAMKVYLSDIAARAESAPPTLRRLSWTDRATAGVQADLRVARKDRLIRRRGWRFGDRMEHVALLAQEG